MTLVVEHPDAESLASLVEGKAPDQERERLLEHLDACEDCRELVTEVVTMLEDASNPEGAEVIDAPWAFPRGVLRLAAVAATLVMAVGVFMLWTFSRPHVPQVAELLAALPPAVVGELPAAWEEPVWATTRGAGGGATANGASLRLGARMVDLAVALETGDEGVVRGILADLERTLAPVAGGEPFVIALRAAAVPGATAGDLAAVDEAALEHPSLDAWQYRLGRWLEAARLALLAGADSPLADARFRREGEMLVRKLPASDGELVRSLLAQPTGADPRSEQLRAIKEYLESR